LPGLEDIDCIVKEYDELDKELVEIDENLIRAELTVLERAELLKRRKEIYEAKHPLAKPEMKRLKGLNVSACTVHELETAPPTFTIDTANKTGYDPSTIRRNIQIASQIIPEVRETLKKTELADSTRELLKLAKLEPEQQKEVAEKIVKGIKQEPSSTVDIGFTTDTANKTGLLLYKLEKSNKIRIHLTHFLLDICGSL